MGKSLVSCFSMTRGVVEYFDSRVNSAYISA